MYKDTIFFGMTVLNYTQQKVHLYFLMYLFYLIIYNQETVVIQQVFVTFCQIRSKVKEILGEVSMTLEETHFICIQLEISES